jgi:hypothetical protein
MSQNASASGTGTTVQFGRDRFQEGNTLFTGVLGALEGYFGVASRGRSTWVSHYAPGLDFLNTASVFSISPVGQGAIYGASRSSDNPTASSSVIADSTLILADDTVNFHTTWGQYVEGDLLAAASAHATQHFNTENVVVNGWTASAEADPYTDNPVRSTFNLRLGSGIGGRTSNTVTAAMSIINETGNYNAGIIFGQSALETSGGTRIAPAIEFAPDQSLAWYSAASTPVWKVYMQTGNVFHLHDVVNNIDNLIATPGAGVQINRLGIGAAEDSLAPLVAKGITSVGVADINSVLESNASGHGVFEQFTDAATYNYAFGTEGATGDFVWYAGRFPGAAGTERMRLTQAGALSLSGVLLVSRTAPTIASGGCTTGSAQSISQSNGSAAFEITLGGATCGSTITLTMPAAAHNWVCDAHNITNPATNVLDMTGAASTTAVVLTNYVRTTGVAGNFTGADHLAVKCAAY